LDILGIVLKIRSEIRKRKA